MKAWDIAIVTLGEQTVGTVGAYPTDAGPLDYWAQTFRDGHVHQLGTSPQFIDALSLIAQEYGVSVMALRHHKPGKREVA